MDWHEDGHTSFQNLFHKDAEDEIVHPKAGQLWKVKVSPYNAGGFQVFKCRAQIGSPDAKKVFANSTRHLKISGNSVIMVTKVEYEQLRHDEASLVINIIYEGRFYQQIFVLPTAWNLKFELVRDSRICVYS